MKKQDLCLTFWRQLYQRQIIALTQISHCQCMEEVGLDKDQKETKTNYTSQILKQRVRGPLPSCY